MDNFFLFIHNSFPFWYIKVLYYDYEVFITSLVPTYYSLGILQLCPRPWKLGLCKNYRNPGLGTLQRIQLGSSSGFLPSIPVLGLSHIVVVVKVHYYFGSGLLYVLEIEFSNLRNPYLQFLVL